MYKKKYLIEGAQVPNEEIYNKIVNFFEKLRDNGQWYKIHPTETLIKKLVEIFDDSEKENSLLENTSKRTTPSDLVWHARQKKTWLDIDCTDVFYIEFSEEETCLIEEMGLFTVEEALHSLNDKGLWSNYNSRRPDTKLGTTEEDIIIEKQVKTLLNIKRGMRI